MDDGKVMKVKSEMFDAFERVRPIFEEYLDSWVLTGTRAGCKTKIVVDSNLWPSVLLENFTDRLEKVFRINPKTRTIEFIGK